MSELKMKQAQGLAPFDPEIRFNAVPVDILGPVTMATSRRAKHVLVLTDLFTMYRVTVPLVSMDSAVVASEIVTNWVLNFGAPNVLYTDHRKSFGGKLIHFLELTKFRLLPIIRRVLDRRIDTTQNSRCFFETLCGEPRMGDSALRYLNFVYNTTVNRITVTPFSMVHGEECQFPVDLFYAKHHDEMLMKNGFAEWLDEQFRDAHSSSGEILRTDQRRQKSYYWKKVHGKP